MVEYNICSGCVLHEGETPCWVEAIVVRMNANDAAFNAVLTKCPGFKPVEAERHG